ncbi:hypothetical protein [Nocardioides aquiterrae]
MRRLLGTLALVLTLAGCGDDVGAGRSPAPGATPDVEVTLVHATAGRGQPEQRATDVTEKAALAAYVAQFSDVLAAKVTKAARATNANPVLAQVVAVGCDVPPGARLEDDHFVPADVAAPRQECFAPVTTVAVGGVVPMQ